MAPQPRQYDDDDGRVICDMDLDGMRWNAKTIRREENKKRNPPQGNQMTKSETLRYVWYSVLSGLLIASVFSITWVLFILFCTKVWFR
jgi:hypothetical protein